MTTTAASESMRSFALLATAFGALGVVFGAFGAHALRGMVDAAALQVWHTAVEYQFWHALVLLVIALAPIAPSRWLRVGAIAFVAGMVLFCGSLYALVLGAPPVVGVITPLGGVALIAAWLCTGMAIWRRVG